jgi:4-alpha-glucanotransferase
MAADDTRLDELANLRGIEPRYVDFKGKPRETSRETKRRLLAAMGFDLRKRGALEAALAQERARPWRHLVEPTVVIRMDDAARLRFHLPAVGDGSLGLAVARVFARLRGERGEIVPLDFRGAAEVARAVVDGIPTIRVEVPVTGLAPGAWDVETYWCGEVPRYEAGRLHVAPPMAFLPASIERGRRILGFAAQLYSLPNFDGGGVGTIAAAGDLAVSLAARGGALLGLSPLHPTPNRAPHDHSPYCPLSREWRNPVLLDLAREPLVWEAPAVKRLLANPKFQREWKSLEASPRVRYQRSMEAKRRVLRAAWGDFGARGGEAAEAFERFLAAGGRSLEDYATFEALREEFASKRPPAFSWDRWPAPFRDPRGEAVRRFRAERAGDVRYHAFLQWLLDRQLSKAQHSARDAGMEVGLYHDLAVGSSGASADAWAQPQLFLRGVEIGAPPDLFQKKGQTWGVVPMDPVRMREAGYEPFVRLLRSAMRHGGALRLDHVMGLWRLWWVPRGRPATEGAYVRYPADDLLALVALESWRNRCLVAGEDLGTVPPGVRERMERERILGCRLVMFERIPGGGFADSRVYPHLSIASFGTHDLPTFTGWWRGRDVTVRHKLRVLSSQRAVRGATEERTREKRELLETFARVGIPVREGGARTPTDALHAYLGMSGSSIGLVSLDDALEIKDQQNMPGTLGEYPNWTGRVGGSPAALASHERLLTAAKASSAGRVDRPPPTTGDSKGTSIPAGAPTVGVGGA